MPVNQEPWLRAASQSLDGAPPAERPPSLSEHVCRTLRDDILSARLTPGQRLTESAIMARTGVSRTPVREGVRRLEAEGLVTSLRGRGTYVTYRWSPDEALLIYECRLVLEPYLTGVAAERMTSATVARIGVALDRFCRAVEDEPGRAASLDMEFHLAIYESSHSPLMAVLRGYWSRMQLDLSERVYRTEVPRRFVREHMKIFEAVEQRDGQAARELMEAHILHGREAIEKALRSERTDGGSKKG